MPYKMISELPQPVKNVLPLHAQEIYLKAFNHAWEEYKSPGKRRGENSREEVAHKVAWTVVKKTYMKKKEEWVKR